MCFFTVRTEALKILCPGMINDPEFLLNGVVAGCTTREVSYHIPIA